MDESRIPWWLVLLLGIGVAGLAVWQSSRWKMQLRLGSGALALVYLTLLAFAIGRDPRSGAAMAWQVSEMLKIGLCGVSLMAAVLLMGRPSFRGQLVWFGLLTFANAGICFASGMLGIASMLAMMGGTVVVLLSKGCRGSPPLTAAELWPASMTEPGGESPFLPWLAGGAGLLLAVALIGTTHHALHAESARATPTRRYSALPSRARIQTVLNLHADEKRSAGLMDQTFSRRADVAVLLAVLVLVSLASTMSSRHVQPKDQVPGEPSPLAQG